MVYGTGLLFLGPKGKKRYLGSFEKQIFLYNEWNYTYYNNIPYHIIPPAENRWGDKKVDECVTVSWTFDLCPYLVGPFMCIVGWWWWCRPTLRRYCW